MVPRGALRLTLLIATAPLLLACRKKPAAGSATLDASADAAKPDGAPSATTLSPSPSPSSLPSPSASARTAPTVTSMFEGVPAPAPTPFAGSYRCLKGLHLVQTGNIVTGTIHTSGSVDTIIACTAGPDTCTGTVRDIEQSRGRAPKVMHVKPITITRSPNGDLLIKPATGAATHCRRS